MREKNCSKCGKTFPCCADGSGCWCENYSLDTNTLKELKQTFENCLCEDCLKAYAGQQDTTQSL